MMGIEVLIPLSVFVSMAFIFWAAFKYNAQKRSAALDTVRAVVEKTGEVTPELIDAIGTAKPKKNADLRKGAILIAIAVAFAALGRLLPEGAVDAASGPMLGVALFPGLVGVVFLAFHFMGGEETA